VVDAVAELLERERHADPVDRRGERTEGEREPAPDLQDSSGSVTSSSSMNWTVNTPNSDATPAG
jgi:hypothetical protein